MKKAEGRKEMKKDECRMKKPRKLRRWAVSSFFILHSAFLAPPAFGETATNAAAAAAITNVPALGTNLPDVGLSVLRVFGALALVLALFLGGVWLFRNWQRLMLQKGRAPKLNILEARPLGNRYALYVVAYEQQRFLIASSPAGITLLSQLPAAEPGNGNGAGAPAAHPVSFAQTLQQLLNRR